MSLTPQQRKERLGKLTASQIGILIRGDENAIINLWREVSGDPSFIELDFSDNWPVQLGTITERLNLDWFVKKNGAVSRRGEVVVHNNGWAACTLDAWSIDHDIPVEAKHVIQYKKMPDVLDWYAPQFHWQMFVTGRKRVAASVIIGSLEPQVTFVSYDESYGAAIVKRAEDFMECVRNMVMPVKQPEIAVPVRLEDMRTEDMIGNNEWAAAAADWLGNKDASKKFEDSKDAIKALIKPDVGNAFGYGIQARKDKKGAVTISQQKEPK